MTLLPRIVAGLRAQGLDDVLVTAGGIIPDDDVPQLKEAGVNAVFGPGTTIRAGRGLPPRQRQAAGGVTEGRLRGAGAERGATRRNARAAATAAALARLLTEVENRTARGGGGLRVLYPLAGAAHLVGVPALRSAGKSTLVAALVTAARRAGRRRPGQSR